MNDLETAIALAVKAHTSQEDKGGNPYILHPLRVMAKFEDKDYMIVAVLHDVIEDSSISLNDLKERGFSDVIIEAIDCLTKKENEGYDSFINRALSNDIARKVKIEDIKDNLDLNRLQNITEKDFLRIKRYKEALQVLTKVGASKANSEQ